MAQANKKIGNTGQGISTSVSTKNGTKDDTSSIVVEDGVVAQIDAAQAVG